MRGLLLTGFASAALAGFALHVAAEDIPANWKNSEPAATATLDLAVPESPAFTVLGVTPENVVRPTSPRQLALSLLNGVDRDGNFQSGIAVDTAPYLLVAGQHLTLQDYRDSKNYWSKRLPARTQVSLATAKGSTTDDKSSRVALGIRVTPWDAGDPRLDDELIDCLRQIQQTVKLAIIAPKPYEEAILDEAFGGPEHKFDNLRATTTEDRAAKIKAAAPAGLDAVLGDLCGLPASELQTSTGVPTVLGDLTQQGVFAALGQSRDNVCALGSNQRLALAKAKGGALSDKLAQATLNRVEGTTLAVLTQADADSAPCRESARRRNWNASSLEFGGAPSWISTRGNVKDLSSSGGALWSSLALNFRDVPILKDAFSDYAKEHSQTIFHVRYRLHQDVADPNMAGNFIQEDDLLLGARLRLGYPNFAMWLEGAFIHADPKGPGHDDSSQLAVGADLRVTKDLWLSLSAGGQGGRANGNNQGFVLSSLKYGFSSEPPPSLQGTNADANRP